jgi:hypothetical protein
MSAYELVIKSLHNIDGIQISQYDHDMGETIDIAYFTPAEWNSRAAKDFRNRNVKYWFLQFVFDHSHVDNSLAVSKCIIHVEIW